MLEIEYLESLILNKKNRKDKEKKLLICSISSLDINLYLLNSLVGTWKLNTFCGSADN